MARGLPEVRPADVRREDDVVAALQVALAPVVLDEHADQPALGVPVGQPGADLLVEAEQVQLLQQAAVVAGLDLRQLLEMGVQLGLRLEGGAVDALQHGPLLVAAPVRPGDGEQLEGADLPGRGHVRPAAQVDEGAAAVDGHRLVRQVVDQLQLVGLGGEELAGLLPVHLLPDKRRFGRHAFLHLLLDSGEVLRHQGPRQVEVVVEAVLDGRADAELGLREEHLHRLRHHVGGRVPHGIESGLVAGCFAHSYSDLR